MVDIRIVDYIRKNINSGYSIDAIKKVLVNNGYSKTEIIEAVEFVNEKPVQRKKNHINFDWVNKISGREVVLFSYTYISLLLGFFSVSYLSLNLIHNKILELVVLALIADVFAFLSYWSVKSIATHIRYLGYFSSIGVLFDLVVNSRAEYMVGAIVVVLFFYTMTFYILEKGILKKKV